MTAASIANGAKTTTLSYTPGTTKDPGHKIVLVVKATGYAGNVQFTIDTVKTTVSSVAITGDTFVEANSSVTPPVVASGNIIPGVTTLTATTTPTTATVSYQWYKLVGANYVAIDGATSKTYQIPSDSSLKTGATVEYKVEVKGTGNYSGTVSDTASSTVDTSAISAGSLKIQKDGENVTTAAAGDVLTAATTVSSAVDSYDYTWYVNDATVSTNKLGEGKTYTVSSGLASNSKIIVVASMKSGVTAFTGTPTLASADQVTVQPAFKSISLTYTNGLVSGTPSYASYTTPSVGNTVVISTDPSTMTGATSYDVYYDSYDKDAKSATKTNISVSGGTFVIPSTVTVDSKTKTVSGHELIVVASNTGYAGTPQASTGKVGNVVQAIGSVSVENVDATTLNATNPATVGKQLKASAFDNTTAKAAIAAGVTYKWQVGGSDVASDAAPSGANDTVKAAYATGMYYTVKDADAGKTITCTATASDTTLASGTATWSNFGVAVQPKAFAVTVKKGTTDATSGASGTQFYVGNVINLSVPNGYTDVDYTWNGVVASGSSYQIPAVTATTSSFSVTVNAKSNGTAVTPITVTFTYHAASGSDPAYFTYTVA